MNNINWEDYILQIFAEANRELGQIKNEQRYIDYADILEKERRKRQVIREAERIINEIVRRNLTKKI